MSKEQDARLVKAMDAVNKIFGVGSIGQLGKMDGLKVERFSSGSTALDAALGGGYPIGRMIEIFGPESSGKTTLTIHAVAEMQKRGGIAAFVDLEHAFDPEYAQALGVDIDRLVFSQPDSGDDAWVVIETLLDNSAVDLIVIDSVAAMVPQKIIDGEIGDANIGLHAKLMSQGLKKTMAKSKKTNTTMIFINQLRANVGVMYGPSEITTGGFALKYSYSQRIEVRRDTAIKDGEVIVANKTRAKIVKNKVGSPHKVIFFNIVFGKGIDKMLELIEAGIQCGLIERKGAWFNYGEISLGQGMIKVKALLEDNEELVNELTDKIWEAFHPEVDMEGSDME